MWICNWIQLRSIQYNITISFFLSQTLGLKLHDVLLGWVFLLICSAICSAVFDPYFQFLLSMMTRSPLMFSDTEWRRYFHLINEYFIIMFSFVFSLGVLETWSYILKSDLKLCILEAQACLILVNISFCLGYQSGRTSTCHHAGICFNV